jgi:hypothetical protein
MPSAFNFIAKSEATSGDVSALTFNSIPNTYEHLYIVYMCRSNRSTGGTDNLRFRYNNDSGGNYYWRCYENGTINGSAGELGSGAGNSSHSLMSVPQITSSDNWESNTWTNGTILIPMYKYTQPKVHHATTQADNNTAYGHLGYTGGTYTPTGAITRIDLFSSTSNNLKQYSVAYLYGISI